MDRFPKDCWTKDCQHFHVWDMSIDDLCCACDEDYCYLTCPLPKEKT